MVFTPFICSFITEEIKALKMYTTYFTLDSKDGELWWILAKFVYLIPQTGLTGFGAQGGPPPDVPQLDYFELK